MKQLFVTNTLGREMQLFTPIEKDSVSVYHCGPTVYWTQHIGNMRAAFFGDIVNRTLRYAGYKVTFVRNYTDVGHLSGDNDGDADTGVDRMEKAANRENKTPEEIATIYIDQFDRDLHLLNVITPEYRPKATEYISPMITFVSELLEKGFAYQTNLAIYFDTSKKEDYFKLSGQKAEELQDKAGHGEVTDSEKRNSTDFAVWFFKSGAHEHALQSWDNPFSETQGFPGWHIECSAMIRDLLGDTIDMHLGGIEHVSIHHTNEIAQSECANNATFANYWLHNEHLDVNGGKMSKSEGTAFSVSELLEKDYDPMDLRYFFLQAHYRSKQNFTYTALDAAKTGRERLVKRLATLADGGLVSEIFKDKFEKVLFEDFNTAGALAVVSEVLKSDLNEADKKATILDFDKVLGLRLDQVQEEDELELSVELTDLLMQRKEAREAKNWTLTDQLRDQIDNLGFVVKDTPEGQKIEKK